MLSDLRRAWLITACAATILMVTTGIRLTSGLFVSPINTATGMGIAAVSLAMAVGQLMWGAAQPVFGAIADRRGPISVVLAGSVLLAGGLVLTTFADTTWELVFAFGILAAAGAGAASFSTLLGVVARCMPVTHRGIASGVLNAGASSGQFLLAPIVQAVIGGAGWTMAMYALAVAALLTVPLAWPMRGGAPGQPKQGVDSVPKPHVGTLAVLSAASHDPSYLLLTAGFFTCGFHLAFLMTHIPVEIGLCGLPASVSANVIAIVGLFNILGSLAAGVLTTRMSMKHLLALIYASRAVIILLYLLLPKTAATFYLLAALLGATWLATVPPTAGLIGRLYGTGHMATLFGLSLFMHQIGGFFGAWLGGLALERFGDYSWMWIADALLALFAAVVNLPIRERPEAPPLATAT